MLTRLEADGFKNLLDFGVDFGPFNCIAGPNGALPARLAETEQDLKRTQELVDSGVLPRGDLLEIEATAATQEQQIINAKNPKTRYLVGSMAKPLAFVRKWFGDRAYDKLIDSMI